MSDRKSFKADDPWRIYNTPAQIQCFCEALLDRWAARDEPERAVIREPAAGTPTRRPPRMP